MLIYTTTQSTLISEYILFTNSKLDTNPIVPHTNPNVKDAKYIVPK